MKSIQARLSLGLLLSLIIVLLGFWLLVSNSIQQLAENYIASRLQHDVETLLTAVSIDTERKLNLNIQRIDSIYERPFSGHYYTIVQGQNRLRSRSLWDQDLQAPVISADHYIQSRQTGPEQQQLLVVSRYFVKQQQGFSISVAEDLTPVLTAIQQFKNRFALLAFAALFLLLVIQIITLRRGLRPLQKIRNELFALQQAKIDSLNTDVPSELKPIIDEINHLLTVLHKRLKRSRDALGDLSHAIKKPLTVLHQLTERLGNSVDKESLTTLSEQLQNIHTLTDSILKRARLAGNVHSGALFDFHSDLPALIKTMRMMYPQKSLNIDSEIAETINTAVDREDMLELLGNLLDNACKWADKNVLISVTQPDKLHIRIEDDGQGSHNSSLQKLGRRGVRLDEDVEGHGFGLAIVMDIVEDYAGTIDFGQSERLGGFGVDVYL